jgi:hypothetical protein
MASFSKEVKLNDHNHISLSMYIDCSVFRSQQTPYFDQFQKIANLDNLIENPYNMLFYYIII